MRDEVYQNNHEVLNHSPFEVIALQDSNEWREVLSQLKDEGRSIVKGTMDNWSTHDANDVLVNVGAAPCVIIFSENGEEIAQGHYIHGHGSYYEFMNWLSDNNQASVYVFGQSFPTRGEPTQYTYEDRKKVDNDLSYAGFQKEQIHDYREKNDTVNAADHVIFDAKNKSAYFLRKNKN